MLFFVSEILLFTYKLDWILNSSSFSNIWLRISKLTSPILSHLLTWNHWKLKLPFLSEALQTEARWVDINFSKITIITYVYIIFSHACCCMSCLWNFTQWYCQKNSNYKPGKSVKLPLPGLTPTKDASSLISRNLLSSQLSGLRHWNYNLCQSLAFVSLRNSSTNTWFLTQYRV